MKHSFIIILLNKCNSYKTGFTFSWFTNVFDRKIFRWGKVIVMSFVWVPFLIFNASKNIKKAMVKNLAACFRRKIAVKNILR